VTSIKKITFRGSFNYEDMYVKLVNKNGKVVYNSREVDKSLRI
jgi:hypothetical protein